MIWSLLEPHGLLESQMPPRCLPVPPFSQMCPRCLRLRTTRKKTFRSNCDGKCNAEKSTQVIQNEAPKAPQIAVKLIKSMVLESVWKQVWENCENPCLRCSKIIFSHGRGCIFQGSQHPRKGDGIPSKSVPKSSTNSLKQ